MDSRGKLSACLFPDKEHQIAHEIAADLDCAVYTSRSLCRSIFP